MNIMKSPIVVLIAALSTLTISAFAADEAPPARQSINGPTGILFLPSAYTQKQRSSGLIGNWWQDALPAVTSNTVAFAGSYGFTDRVEGGFFFNRRSNRGGNTNNGGGFVKFQLSPEGEHEPAMAIGVAGGAGDNNPLSAYFVISHNVSSAAARNPLNLHVGVEYSRLRDFPAPPAGGSSSVRPYGAMDLAIGSNAALLGEVRLKHQFETKTMISGGIGYGFGRTFRVTAGATNSGISQGLRPFVMAAFQFTLPASK